MIISVLIPTFRRAVLENVPGLGIPLRTFDASCYNRLLCSAMTAANRRCKFDALLWLGDYAHGRVGDVPSVGFAQGTPGTDARSVLAHWKDIRSLAGLLEAWKWRILARLRLSPIGSPPFASNDRIIMGSTQSQRTLTKRYNIPPEKIRILPSKFPERHRRRRHCHRNRACRRIGHRDGDRPLPFRWTAVRSDVSNRRFRFSDWAWEVSSEMPEAHPNLRRFSWNTRYRREKKGSFECLRMEGSDLEEANELIWRSYLDRALCAAGKTKTDIAHDKKSAPWKIWITSKLKRHTSAPGSWIAQKLNMGGTSTCRRLRQSTASPTKTASST